MVLFIISKEYDPVCKIGRPRKKLKGNRICRKAKWRNRGEMEEKNKTMPGENPRKRK